MQFQERLNNELQQLVIDIQRVGEGPQVLFGELFDDDEVQQHYEGLAATLKAAKKRECCPLPYSSRVPMATFLYFSNAVNG